MKKIILGLSVISILACCDNISAMNKMKKTASASTIMKPEDNSITKKNRYKKEIKADRDTVGRVKAEADMTEGEVEEYRLKQEHKLATAGVVASKSEPEDSTSTKSDATSGDAEATDSEKDKGSTEDTIGSVDDSSDHTDTKAKDTTSDDEKKRAERRGKDDFPADDYTSLFDEEEGKTEINTDSSKDTDTKELDSAGSTEYDKIVKRNFSSDSEEFKEYKPIIYPSFKQAVNIMEQAFSDLDSSIDKIKKTIENAQKAIDTLTVESVGNNVAMLNRRYDELREYILKLPSETEVEKIKKSVRSVIHDLTETIELVKGLKLESALKQYEKLLKENYGKELTDSENKDSLKGLGNNYSLLVNLSDKVTELRKKISPLEKKAKVTVKKDPLELDKIAEFRDKLTSLANTLNKRDSRANVVVKQTSDISEQIPKILSMIDPENHEIPKNVADLVKQVRQTLGVIDSSVKDLITWKAEHKDLTNKQLLVNSDYQYKINSLLNKSTQTEKRIFSILKQLNYKSADKS